MSRVYEILDLINEIKACPSVAPIGELATTLLAYGDVHEAENVEMAESLLEDTAIEQLEAVLASRNALEDLLEEMEADLDRELESPEPCDCGCHGVLDDEPGFEDDDDDLDRLCDEPEEEPEPEGADAVVRALGVSESNLKNPHAIAIALMPNPVSDQDRTISEISALDPELGGSVLTYLDMLS